MCTCRNIWRRWRHNVSASCSCGVTVPNSNSPSLAMLTKWAIDVCINWFRELKKQHKKRVGYKKIFGLPWITWCDSPEIFTRAYVTCDNRWRLPHHWQKVVIHGKPNTTLYIYKHHTKWNQWQLVYFNFDMSIILGYAEKSKADHFRRGLYALKWRRNERGSVTNHQQHDCLLNDLFRRR